MSKSGLNLFGGVGGWEVAARQLDVDSVLVENDPWAAQTARDAGHRVEQKDVARMHPTDFGQPRIEIGSPPCTAFTNTGHGHGRDAIPAIMHAIKRMDGESNPTRVCNELDAEMRDKTAGLVLQPLRYALLLEPQAIALEQVPPVLPLWQAYEPVLRGLGYSVWTGVLSAERYDTPQNRKRAVLIASKRHRVGRPTPVRTLYAKGGLSDLPRWLSIRDTLPYLSREGHVRSNYSTGGDPSNRGRRMFDEPSATITSKFNRNKVVEVINDVASERALSIAEGAALQGFPADYPWTGERKGDIYQQIGNAIPPPLAWHILREALGLPVAHYPAN